MDAALEVWIKFLSKLLKNIFRNKNYTCEDFSLSRLGYRYRGISKCSFPPTNPINRNYFPVYRNNKLYRAERVDIRSQPLERK